ncbi:seminase [Stomoxys calcitrans]|uniref:seminase n=1 Tax=Stomoxys calcitrans TaxID=35570 RepID=UPI0027E309F7|nr:seminase [Stomoxys calcitrans]
MVKIFPFCILTLWLWRAAAARNATSIGQRIVGGEVTTISEEPYMVQILNQGTFSCGGCMIRQRYVLSAAHCFGGTRPADITVVAGATRLAETGIRRKVSDIFIPPRWNPNTMYMDIAVLKLAFPITADRVQTIGLYSGNLNPGMMVKVNGWGRISEGGRISQQIRSVQVPVIDQDRCRKQYEDVIYIGKTMFCAGVLGSKDSCSGDSGGPVVFQNSVCGVVSFGVGCARDNFAGVYTRISEAIDFIRNALTK